MKLKLSAQFLAAVILGFCALSASAETPQQDTYKIIGAVEGKPASYILEGGRQVTLHCENANPADLGYLTFDDDISYGLFHIRNRPTQYLIQDCPLLELSLSKISASSPLIFRTWTAHFNKHIVEKYMIILAIP